MSITTHEDLSRPRASVALRLAVLRRAAAWRARRRDAALLRGLSREAAFDLGLEDWRMHRSEAEPGPIPTAPDR
jgi:hypothetical protein